MTDFIAVLPFASKGIELMYNGSRRTYSTVSYVYGAENMNDVAVAETWVAFCEMKPYVFAVGAFCLILITIEIIIGLFLERRARKQLEKYVLIAEESDVKDNSHPSNKIDVEMGDDNVTNSWSSRGNGLLWYLSQSQFDVTKQTQKEH